MIKREHLLQMGFGKLSIHNILSGELEFQLDSSIPRVWMQLGSTLHGLLFVSMDYCKLVPWEDSQGGEYPGHCFDFSEYEETHCAVETLVSKFRKSQIFHFFKFF